MEFEEFYNNVCEKIIKKRRKENISLMKQLRLMIKYNVPNRMKYIKEFKIDDKFKNNTISYNDIAKLREVRKLNKI